MLLEHPAFGLLWPPGAGKTVTVLTALEALKRAGVGPALVVAPLRVCTQVWQQEAKRWEHTQSLRFSFLHGDRSRAAREDADVYLLNYDGLSWLKSGWKHFSRKPQVLVLDESTAIKNSRTGRFRAVKLLLPLFRRRYLMTGTPAPNGLLDLWSQVYALDLGRALSPYVTRYRDQFFNSSGFGGYTWTLKEGADEEIYKRISNLVHNLSRDEAVKLPPLVTSPMYVDLPKSAALVYAQLEAELLAYLESGEEVTVANAAVLANKLRQVASGALYDDRGIVRELHTAKYDAVEEWVESLAGQPAMVVVEYRHETEQLQKRLLGWPALDGNATPAMTTRIVKGWNAGELPGVLVHPAAAGHGLNLQHGPGNQMLWTSGTWSLELAEQMVGRLWRQGQRNTVYVHRLMARGTIDEDLWSRVDDKDRQQQQMLAFLRGAVQRRA